MAVAGTLLGRTSLIAFGKGKSAVHGRRVQLADALDDDDVVPIASETEGRSMARRRSEPCCNMPASPCSTMTPMTSMTSMTPRQSSISSMRERSASASRRSAGGRVEKSRQTPGGRVPADWWSSKGTHQETMQVYLPMTWGGVRILVNQGGDMWLVDNSALEASTQGLGYRHSKKSDDRVGINSFAAWGTFVKGVDTGGGWLQTVTQASKGSSGWWMFDDSAGEEDGLDTEDQDMRRLSSRPSSRPSFMRMRTDSTFGMPVAPHSTISPAIFSAMLQRYSTNCEGNGTAAQIDDSMEDNTESIADESEDDTESIAYMRRLSSRPSFMRIRTDSCFGMPISPHSMVSPAELAAMLRLHAGGSSCGKLNSPRPTSKSSNYECNGAAAQVDSPTQGDNESVADCKEDQNCQQQQFSMVSPTMRKASSVGRASRPRPLKLQLSDLIGGDVECADNGESAAKKAEENFRASMPLRTYSHVGVPLSVPLAVPPAMPPASAASLAHASSPAMSAAMSAMPFSAMPPSPGMPPSMVVETHGAKVYNQQIPALSPTPAVQQSPKPNGAGVNRRCHVQENQLTTICFRNLPNNYSSKMVLGLLDSKGFKDTYDFVYVPHDFQRLPQLVNVGYFFVNFLSHEVAAFAVAKLAGFKKWKVASGKVLTGTWAEKTQGRSACVERCKCFTFAHENIPSECKPMLFEHGALVPDSSSNHGPVPSKKAQRRRRAQP